ncbi:Hypothetical protein A7982_02632 [Minicystis rosea]|nr:Hypothetical protein A7982_02632 [Minicystis rosea]
MRSLIGILVAGALVTLGCGGDVQGGSGGSASDGGGGSGGAASNGPAFAEIYAKVFTAGSCTSDYCHAGSSLNLVDQEKARATLVGIASQGEGCDEMARVVPGDPEHSLLYLKVSMTTPPCGARMPIAGAHLDAAQIALLRAWIEAGAPE